MASIPQQDIPGRDYAQGRSLMGLFADLWRETQTLVHQETQLAKAEISEKVSQLATGAGEIAAGGAVLFAAVGALELMINSPHAIWLAPLIVGVVVMIVGYIILSRGRSQMKAENLTPERTMQSLQRDAKLAKEHAT